MGIRESSRVLANGGFANLGACLRIGDLRTWGLRHQALCDRHSAAEEAWMLVCRCGRFVCRDMCLRIVVVGSWGLRHQALCDRHSAAEEAWMLVCRCGRFACRDACLRIVVVGAWGLRHQALCDRHSAAEEAWMLVCRCGRFVCRDTCLRIVVVGSWGLRHQALCGRHSAAGRRGCWRVGVGDLYAGTRAYVLSSWDPGACATRLYATATPRLGGGRPPSPGFLKLRSSDRIKPGGASPSKRRIPPHHRFTSPPIPIPP